MLGALGELGEGGEGAERRTERVPLAVGEGTHRLSEVPAHQSRDLGQPVP